ncbi:hypothetical protein, partial [Enterococcus faecalis]|uniref:hypothetical protein n=2 Tax=Enterococcus faecalis TaxID=1351 RepID=UPI001C4E3E19
LTLHPISMIQLDRIIYLRIILLIESWGSIMGKENTKVLEQAILNIPDETQYWLCRANGGEFFQDFRKNNFISVSSDGVSMRLLKSNDVEFEEDDKKDALILDYYKSVFLNSDYHKDNLSNLNKEFPENIKENEKSYKRKAGISATKVFNFIELMNIGDFVLVPGTSSDGFAIGIVISNAFSLSVNRLTDDVSKLCDYEIKRSVRWITDITRKQLPSNLYWVLSAHQTLFNITSHAIDFNKLIGSSYVYHGTFYHQLIVGTDDPINSYQWFQLQKAIYEVSEEKSEEIFIKTKVQSNGLIEFVTNPAYWPLIIIGGAVLFGDVSADLGTVKAKFKSPLLYFMPGARKKREQEQKKAELEIRKIEIEIEELEKRNGRSSELINLEIENKKTDLEIKKEALAASKIDNKLKVLEYDEQEKKINSNQIPKLDNKQRKAISELKISSPDYEETNEKQKG